MINKLIYKPILHKVLRQNQQQIVQQLIELLLGKVTGGRHGSAHRLPQGIDHHLVLLTVLGRGRVPDKHLARTFVLSVPDELHVHAHFIQDVLEENQLGREAKQAVGIAMGRCHVNLIGHRREIVRPVPGGLRIGYHRLSAGAEGLQGPAELFQLGHAGCSAIGPQVNELDSRVVGGFLQGHYGVVDAHGRKHTGHSGQRETGSGFAHGLLSQRELGEVDVQHSPALGKGGGALAQGCHTAQHHQEKHEANHGHHNKRGNDRQHCLDKIFHIT